MDKGKLAELIGIILGDGHLHKKDNCLTITGSIEDYYYYQKISKIMFRLFNKKAKIRKRNDRNSFYIMIYSKEMMEFLTKIGMIRGNKKYAKIPKFIFDEEEYLKSFTRGLFDTDGSLKFSKQLKNKNYYPRIQFCFKISNFAFEVEKIFLVLGFNYSKWIEKNDNRNLVYYQVSGNKNLEKWNNMIGFRNPVHLTKYLFWKKFGYCIPKSSLKMRLKTLNLNINDLK